MAVALGLMTDRERLLLAEARHGTANVFQIVTFTGQVREAIDEEANCGDAVTADVLTDVVRAADQAVWTQEANLELAESVASQVHGASL